MADSAIASCAAKIGAAERTASVSLGREAISTSHRSPTGVIDAWPSSTGAVMQPAALDLAGELEAAQSYALAGLSPAILRAYASD
jgi:hypothetical protein